MEHIKAGVEKLLCRLVGTWDFMLYDYSEDPEDKYIRHRYVIQGLSYTPEDMVMYGHDAVDNTSFHIFFAPTTIAERDYLFSMSDNDEHGEIVISTVYNFNQREYGTILGVFRRRYSWVPRVDASDTLLAPIILTGKFIASFSSSQIVEEEDKPKEGKISEDETGRHLENYFQEEYDHNPSEDNVDFGPRNDDPDYYDYEPDMDDGEYNPYEDDNKV